MTHLKNYGFLGIGAFGGNITRQFEEAGYLCIVANSSAEDLKQILNAKNKIHFNGGSGCHKNRKKAKELLKTNLETLINEVKAKMPEITNLFIFAPLRVARVQGCLPHVPRFLKTNLESISALSQFFQVNPSNSKHMPTQSNYFKK